jgi:hypothetical protein
MVTSEPERERLATPTAPTPMLPVGTEGWAGPQRNTSQLPAARPETVTLQLAPLVLWKLSPRSSPSSVSPLPQEPLSVAATTLTLVPVAVPARLPSAVTPGPASFQLPVWPEAAA